MIYTLKYKDLMAKIDTKGAFVLNLVYKDIQIFSTKKEITVNGALKPRGGMHVCWPNFGKSMVYNLHDHGFARENVFEVIDKTDTKIDMKVYGRIDYRNVECRIIYELKENKFITTLYTTNYSQNNKLIAPGFHPYFNTSIDNLEIDNIHIDDNKLKDTIFFDINDVSFKTKDFSVNLITENMYKYAIWTDKKDEYVCIEPTYRGVMFKNESDGIILYPREQFVQKIIFELS